MPASGLAFFIWHGPGEFSPCIMKSLRLPTIGLLSIILIGTSFVACTTVDRGWSRNGMITPAGRPSSFQSTTTWAIHLGCGYFPFWGDASMEGSVKSFTEKAREIGAAKFEITNVDAENYCMGILGLTILPIIITPMKTTIYGHTYPR